MSRFRKLIDKAFTRRPRLKAKHLARMSPKEVFDTIYERNAWNGADSVSGKGSDREQTAQVAAELPRILRELKAESLLDIPCGDFYWMRHVDLAGVKYIGADIVSELVARNEAYADATRSFIVCDLMQDELPPVDIVFCRDCLVHFSNTHVWQTLRNIAHSDAKYLITTTFTQRTNEKQIETGQWRPLNLQVAPFNLPQPTRLIDERCTHDGGAYPDKMLGVWSVEVIRKTIGELRDAA